MNEPREWTDEELAEIRRRAREMWAKDHPEEAERRRRYAARREAMAQVPERAVTRALAALEDEFAYIDVSRGDPEYEEIVRIVLSSAATEFFDS